MFQVLLALLILDSFLLIGIVLLQAGKGGGLAAMGAAGAGTDSLFGSRQTATLLTKLTWWGGGIFLVLSFILSFVGSPAASRDSILRGAGAPAAAPAIPAPSTGTTPATGVPAAGAAATGGAAATPAPATQQPAATTP